MLLKALLSQSGNLCNYCMVIQISICVDAILLKSFCEREACGGHHTSKEGCGGRGQEERQLHTVS